MAYPSQRSLKKEKSDFWKIVTVSGTYILGMIEMRGCQGMTMKNIFISNYYKKNVSVCVCVYKSDCSTRPPKTEQHSLQKHQTPYHGPLECWPGTGIRATLSLTSL